MQLGQSTTASARNSLDDQGILKMIVVLNKMQTLWNKLKDNYKKFKQLYLNDKIINYP